MYEIHFSGKQRKRFKQLLDKLSPEVKDKIKDTLKNHPYPSSIYGETLCKVERKGKLYGIEVTGGDRVLYDIIKIDEDKKFVLILYSGDDDGEIRFLKKHAK